MLELDGSAGGGQLIRTALSLAAVTGEPFRMRGIRAERPKPGLRPQHLAAVRVVADLTDGDVTGATEGSGTLEFHPGRIRPGRYSVDVGTAGSLTLLFDTVLPLAERVEGTLTLEATGGTDVRWSPPMDYLRQVKLPLLRRHGVAVAVDLDRRGFYPAGGGAATVTFGPSNVEPFELDPADSTEGVRVFSVATDGLAEREVAERQAETAVAALGEHGLDVTNRVVEYATADSTGSAITIRFDRDGSPSGADALGERGTPAEQVAERAVERAIQTNESGAAVDENLADQLLVFLGLAGGRVAIPRVTDHVETNVALLERFGYDVAIDERDNFSILSA